MFEKITAAPPDAILGLSEAFKSDPNPNKINLGVGVYKDANGNTPILATAKKAEQMLLSSEKSKSYLPIDGNASYDAATQKLILGAEPRDRRQRPRCHRADAGRHRCAARGRRLHRQQSARGAHLAQRTDLAQSPGCLHGGRRGTKELPLL